VVREVVREVWRLFLARFWRTLIIVAVLLAPLQLLVKLLDPDLSSVDQGWWVWVAVSATVTLVAFPWVIGSVVHDVATGDRSAAGAYARTASRLPDLVISAAVTTAGILLGTLAFVLPGLLLMARWALVVPLVVLEGADWRRAISRSNELVRGRTWSVVGIFVLLTVIGAALVVVPVLIGRFALQGILGAWFATLAIDTVAIAFYSFAPFVLHRRLGT
jgi:Membrane domain of glycerophosphoryl diester phosphodiesterase